jgi:hypothetical protein
MGLPKREESFDGNRIQEPALLFFSGPHISEIAPSSKSAPSITPTTSLDVTPSSPGYIFYVTASPNTSFVTASPMSQQL